VRVSTDTGAPDPSAPEAIDDVAMVGLSPAEDGCLTLVLLSGNPDAPIYVARDITIAQAKKIQIALGRKIRAQKG
jgi:hypothetical protein